ncbi:MAG TPA: hypothetical protein DD734_06955 [Firmicutes bacterium]|nr:hypothetical protein [Bacillota bacterium]
MKNEELGAKMMIGTTIKTTEKNLTAELAAQIELMDMKTINQFWDEQINILDRKLIRFHQEFHTQVAGYSPDFMFDLIYAKKLILPLVRL